MAEVEEPVFTSLAARKAALMQQQQQNGASNTSKNGISFGKRPPPPPPPDKNRPALPLRTQTINNPPIASYGSSVTKAANNLPINARGQSLLPPPPVDRDQVSPTSSNGAKSPSLPPRNGNGPPPLPGRKASSPALPPRKASTQLTRRGSNDSTTSFSSTISGMSLGHSTTASSIESQGRRLPPALADAKLPPLPPSRRDTEDKAKTLKIKPLVTTRSTPNVPLLEPPPIDRDTAVPPRMPPRPNGAPRLPSRSHEAPKVEDDAPVQPKRSLPPQTTARNILSMGFGNKQAEPSFSRKDETPVQPPRPIPTFTKPPAGPIIHELNLSNFDSTIRGKYAFISFGRPSTCTNCQYLAPHLEEAAEKFAFASDRLIIGTVNVDEWRSNRYQVRMLPTVIFFDGSGDNYDKFREGGHIWSTEELVEYLERKTGIKVSDGLQPASNGTPPPIPLASKPKLNALVSRPAPVQPASSGCLICRDFSGPDNIAQQYPRQNLPQSRDLTGYLADVLCSPFQSHTDKARAIFTWLHHNVNYDVDAFFGNRVKHVEPADTIRTGLAVCGGYAGLYAAIALKAGLQCVMVTGHGKGFGYTKMKPEDPVPPVDPTGHAWNAVRIDGGEWKLVDPCWGAGNVIGDSRDYNKDFTPSWFTKSNVDFGSRHFPQDKSHFYRADRSIPTWEEYMRGPATYETISINGSAEAFGVDEKSFQPAQKQIRVNTREMIRFQFSKPCEHWDHERNGPGKPYCMILKIHGRDGRKDDFVPFESNDFWWWADVAARDLGAPGQSVSVLTVMTVNGQDMRGMTSSQYMQKKGKYAMSFGVICTWDLV